MPLVPSAAGAGLAFTPQCGRAGGCLALGLGWPLISLLAHFATFPGGLPLSPGVMDQLRGQRGGDLAAERGAGRRGYSLQSQGF